VTRADIDDGRREGVSSGFLLKVLDANRNGGAKRAKGIMKKSSIDSTGQRSSRAIHDAGDAQPLRVPETVRGNHTDTLGILSIRHRENHGGFSLLREPVPVRRAQQSQQRA